MTGAHITIHEAGIDELMASPKAAILVAAQAKAVASAAADLAPARTGDLRRSYKATRAVYDGTSLVATAYSDDFKAHWYEWGTIKIPAVAPLRRAASRLGLKSRLAPKGQA